MAFIARQAEERVAFTFLFMKEMYLEDSYLWAFDATVEDTLRRRRSLIRLHSIRSRGASPRTRAFFCGAIEGIDRQACGGTHIKNTGEIGKIKMIKAENKGKANRRVYFSLED